MVKNWVLMFIAVSGLGLVSGQPLPPQNVTTEVIVNQTGVLAKVKLTWLGNVTPLPGSMHKYNVYRKDESDSSFFRKIAAGLYSSYFYDYTVHFNHSYSYYITAYNLQGESSPSDSVRVSIVITPPQYSKAVITGSVLKDADGTPLRNVKVRLISRTSPQSYFGLTDSLGIYKVRAKAGTYFLQYSAIGYIPEYFDNAVSFTHATEISLQNGDSLIYNAGLASVISPVLYSLSGSVEDSSGNKHRAVITAYRIRANTFQSFRYRTVTDSNGHYSLSIRAGDTVVIFAAPLNRDFYPVFYNNRATFSEADRLVLNENKTDINFVINRRDLYPNSLTGVVKDSAGNAVESYVSALKLNGNSFFVSKRYNAVTDSLGVYSFTNLLPGKYIIKIMPMSGYLPTWFRYDGANTLRRIEADSVLVDSASVITGIDVIVKPLTDTGFAFVFGRVSALNGQTVTGALVLISSADGIAVTYGMTDQFGNYRIENLPLGIYKITALTDIAAVSEEKVITIENYNTSGLVVNLNMQEGNTTTTEEAAVLITGFELEQNYPNPFNPTTTIQFTTPDKRHIQISVYNVLGDRVAMLYEGEMPAGTYHTEFDASMLPSGVYFYKLESGTKNITKKMLYLK